MGTLIRIFLCVTIGGWGSDQIAWTSWNLRVKVPSSQRVQGRSGLGYRAFWCIAAGSSGLGFTGA